MNLRIYLAIFLFIILGLSSCFSPKNQADKTVFRYNEAAGINTLDPAYARYLEDMRAINQLYDGLVKLGDDLSIQTDIARSYEISDDGLIYTFHLRDDVYFSDHEVFPYSKGRKVIADDFVFSFERILDPKTASPGMWIFNAVADEEPFKAKDDSTLIIRLKQAFPPFLGILSMPYCNAIPREAVEKYGEDFRSNPVGSGPFKKAFWIEGSSLVLHKNENYWKSDNSGVKLPYLDAVRIDFQKDKTTMFLDFLKGNYDFISGIDASYKDELLTQNGELSEVYKEDVVFQKAPFMKTDYIGFLVDEAKLESNSPVLNKKFRQALNLSVDRAKLIKYLRNNSVISSENGFLPQGFQAHGLHAHTGWKYDLKKAKKLLKEVSIPSDFVLTISTTSAYTDICEYLQYQWKALGVEVRVETLQSSNHRDLVANGELMAFRKSWLADYADEENFLGLFYSKNHSPGGPNYTHFTSVEYDSLYEASLAVSDYKNRVNLYGKMDSIILEESPVVPLFYDQVSHFLRKEIEGFSTNPINMLDLSTVQKKK